MTLNPHTSCLAFLRVQSTVPANKSYVLTKIVYIYVSICLRNTGGSDGKELASNAGDLRKEIQAEHKIWKIFHFYSLHSLITPFPTTLPVKYYRRQQFHLYASSPVKPYSHITIQKCLSVITCLYPPLLEYKLLMEYILFILNYCSLCKKEKFIKISDEIKYTLCPIERETDKQEDGQNDTKEYRKETKARWKDTPQDGRKQQQIKQPTEHQLPKYTSSSYNSTPQGKQADPRVGKT